jgi:hypothetical protein
MSELHAFRTNLRLFRELCEETMRVSGTSPKGLRGVADLRALEAVYAAEVPFRGELLQPLSAFSNLLISGRLPSVFTPLDLGDALGALGEVLASKGAGKWRFDPDVSKRTGARLAIDRMGRGLDRLRRENEIGWEGHARENARFIVSAMDRCPRTDAAVIVGGARAYDVPLAEIARRFARVIVVDICDENDVRNGIRRAVSDPALLTRISVERFDLTGVYNQFVADVASVVARAQSEHEAERRVDELVSSYDVPTEAVRLCRAPIDPDFAVSSMVLTQLGLPFQSFTGRVFQERGFRAERTKSGMLEQSLWAFASRLEQHHIGALLRIPRLAALTSDVSERAVTLGARGEIVGVGEPRTQLSVESLVDRIPRAAAPIAHGSWDWLRIVPKRPGAPGASMSVEGLVLGHPH